MNSDFLHLFPTNFNAGQITWIKNKKDIKKNWTEQKTVISALA